MRIITIQRVLPAHLQLFVRLSDRLSVALGPPAVSVAAEVSRRPPVEQEQTARRRRWARRRARDREVVQAVVAEEVDDVFVAEPGPSRASQDVAEWFGGVPLGVEALGGAGHGFVFLFLWSGLKKAAAAVVVVVEKRRRRRLRDLLKSKTSRALCGSESSPMRNSPRSEPGK